MPLKEKPDYWYRQSGVIPLRHGDAGAEVLLVTSLKGKRWIIPKGIVEPGMSAAESALREAWEEAGVRGTIRPNAVGSYRYRKWGKVCSVAVFVLDVEEVLETWPEHRLRERRWHAPLEAAAKMREEELRDLIAGAVPAPGTPEREP